MSQLQRGGWVVGSRKISIIPQANSSYNNSTVIIVLCRSVVTAMPLLRGRDFRDSNGPLAIFLLPMKPIGQPVGRGCVQYCEDE